MTEPSTEDVPVPAAESAQEPPAEQPAGDHPTDRQTARDERVRAERDALRTERDALAGQVVGLRDAELLRRAGRAMNAPADLLLVTTAAERAEVWNEQGEIDEGRMAALVDSVLDQHPNWRIGTGISLDLGPKPNTRAAEQPSWAGLVRRRG